MPPLTIFANPADYKEHGLFVWRKDDRYAWDERLDGKTYSRVTAAKSAADKRNAAGEHGGMIVVRPRALIHGTRINRNPPRKRASSRTVRKNPPEPTAVAILSNRLMEIRYKHAEDGKLYRHPFKAGVRMVLMSDGSIRVVGTRGQPLWGDF